MKRTKLCDRRLPDYTKGEEIFNAASHGVGAVFGAAALAGCVFFSAKAGDPFAVAGSAIYGAMMIFLYTMSAVYHGLRPGRAKKVMQVMDHCTIYALILGSYAPVLLTRLRTYNPGLALLLAGIVFAGAAVGVTFTAIDFKRYRLPAYGGYLLVGWTALFAVKPLIAAFGKTFFLWLLAGGVAYTLGVVFYGVGIRKRWFHGVFHLFILAGTVLQFIAVFGWCVPH